MANEKQSGTAVQPATTATAEVNAPRSVTLYSRVSGREVGTYPEPEAVELQRENPNLTPMRYDLEACEDDFFAALAVVEPVARVVAESRRRRGYVPEVQESAMALAMSDLHRANKLLALGYGQMLPTEAEVSDWAEHESLVGTKDESYNYSRGEDGAQLEADIMIKPLAAYDSMGKARTHAAAIAAYLTEHGGRDVNA